MRQHRWINVVGLICPRATVSTPCPRMKHGGVHSPAVESGRLGTLAPALLGGVAARWAARRSARGRLELRLGAGSPPLGTGCGVGRDASPAGSVVRSTTACRRRRAPGISRHPAGSARRGPRLFPGAVAVAGRPKARRGLPHFHFHQPAATAPAAARGERRRTLRSTFCAPRRCC